MYIIIFLLYLLLFIWLINRINFFKKSRLTAFWLSAFFIVKVLAGVLYGIFHTKLPNYQETADTWTFYYNSLNQTKLLLHNPWQFFSELFSNPYEKKYQHLFSSNDSFWNDLRHSYMIKLVAIMNLFSGSRYYVNVIFYSFITFFGPIAFIILMRNIFKDKLALIAGTTFLIPSFLFWTSGIHKDGIVFTAICLIAYVLHFKILNNSFSIKSIIFLLLILLSIFPLRNYIVLALVPTIIAWWWASKMNHYKWVPFVAIFIIGSTIFFTTKYLYPKLDLPIAIVMRNKEFTQLGGHSILPQPPLESNFKSFLQGAPVALNHVLARPYLHEAKSITYFLSALEIICMWLLFFIWVFRYKETPIQYEVILFFITLSFILLLITGYIVPQLGALVRYRSIYFPFLIVPLICTIQWGKHIK